MNAPNDYPSAEYEAEPAQHYLNHWRDAAADPSRFGFEPQTPEWAAFRGMAYTNDRVLRFYDEYLTEAIPQYEQLLLDKKAQDYPRSEMDLSIYYDITNWYRRLGSFNTLDGALELGLRATAIMEQLADNPTLSPEFRESIDVTIATLYHELALTTPIGEKQLFSALSGEALQRYEIALTDPDGYIKIQRWQDQSPLNEKITPHRTRNLLQATARNHDLVFEILRRSILEKMGGDVMGEARPHYVQSVQAEARRRQALALNDFASFLALGTKKVNGEPLIRATQVYDWFVELAIRNKQIVDNNGIQLLRNLVSRQVRTAFPREDAPHDDMRRFDMPLLAFDMLAQTFDRTGQPDSEAVPVQIKAQGRDYISRFPKNYAPVIYVLDLKEEASSDGTGHLKVPYISRPQLSKWATQLQRELAIAPGDVRAIQRQREGKLGAPFQFEM